ncbi:glutamate--tRNA ligase [Candidatus Micrarchaeota archaeon]|nr:glutamate--tRNA ligase [Candidatus Micrarchaeota archaeon]
MVQELEVVIRKHALKNAFDYGKASLNTVVGKVIAEKSEAKNNMEETMRLTNQIVEEVNKMKKEEIEKELGKYDFVVKKVEEEKKIRLGGVEYGKVVTRFLPEPNAPLHIGHAKAAFLSYEAAKEYWGKCILRWDDTNPKKEKQEYVDEIRKSLAWLGLAFASEGYASDKMPLFYRYAEQLINQGDAYACKCKKEKINESREKGKACNCRSRSENDNLELWNEMLGGRAKKGDVVLRLKGNVGSLNTVMRDPTLFRIITTPHFRQGNKYRVWPTYDFEASISDSLDGVTHAFRSKEYELRDELYYYILNKLNLRKPIVYDFSRLNIKGTLLSKRALKPLIEGKKVSGMDDPRLPTLSGLRRRGILPEAIRSFVLSFGLSKVESEPTWEALLAENRKMLDPVAERYFFVAEPILLKVDKVKEGEAFLPKHPSKNLGQRRVGYSGRFYISKNDADKLQEREVLRLKDLFNVELVKRGKTLSGRFAGKELIQDSKKLQWVSGKKGEFIEAEVLVPGDLFVDGKLNPKSLMVEKGYCEKACGELKKGSVIQFERFGFVKLDEKKRNKLVFIFTC